jgi:hypothetical protein
MQIGVAVQATKLMAQLDGLLTKQSEVKLSVVDMNLNKLSDETLKKIGEAIGDNQE